MNALAIALGPLMMTQPAHPGALLSGATTVEITSIDPSNTEFEDLEPLRELIGDARVVVLGEQSHGDGAVFLCKARLVTFLHEEMGFNVLAWESGVLGCDLMNERIADPDVPIGEAFDGVFPIWTRSLQVLPTLEYARQTNSTETPLVQAGFDAQLTSQRTGPVLAARMRSLLETFKGREPTAVDVAAAAQLVELSLGSDQPMPVSSMKDLANRLDVYLNWLDQRRAVLDEAHGAAEVEFTRRRVSDAAWYMRMGAHMRDGGGRDTDLFNERDRRMGDNLAYLADERFKGEKIIVWAATRHMVHRQKEIAYPDVPGIYDEMDSAGETAFDHFGDELYTIGFTALRGEAGNCFRDQTMPLEEPREGSIEWALDAIEHPFVLLDFRSLPDDHPLRDEQMMRPLGYGWMTAKWPEQMDAVISIDEMFKSDARVYAPDGYSLTIE